MAKQTKKTEETTTPEVTKDTSYVEPSMNFDEKHKNEFVEYVKEDEPELKAVGYARVPGTNNYAAFVITFKGNQISKMSVDEPNILRVAEDAAKGLFVAEIIKMNEEF